MLSLAGIYRNYYELLEKDRNYKGKVSIVIVFDGYEVFNKSCNPRTNKRLAETFYEIGLYDEKETKNFYEKIEKKKDEAKYYEYKFSDLKFMNLNNEEEKKDNHPGNNEFDIERGTSRQRTSNRISFESNNLAHVFSAELTFENFVEGLTAEEKGEFKIDRYDFNDFMLGNSKQGEIKEHIFTHELMDVHLVVKHMNRGKIESHLWYFKGFCSENPEFCFIIDAGTVAHHNSISRIIFEMEADKSIGGA
jgi:cellulose synthase/poly-beta-1,6-N-acetylglucosamine synthase-like glycosyltransferase